MHEIHALNEEAWQEWLDWRQAEKKVKVGPMAAKKQQKLLTQYPPPVQQTIIDQSIMNSYQGLFPPKGVAQQDNSTRNISLHDSLNDRSWAH